MKKKSIAVLVAIFALMIITQTGCSSENSSASANPVSKENFLLDTVCNISIYEMTDQNGDVIAAEDNEDAANEAINDAYSLCAELDKTLSRTQEASDIYKVNHAGGEWVEVSDYTIDIVEKGLYYSELSDGQYDITVGGITELWDFHADEEDAKLPDADELAEAVKHIGYKNVEISGNKLRLADPETKIDLGGIAKGYIGDRMAEVLENAGVTSGIINLGGNVICIGGKDNSAEDGEGGFNIGVEAPFSDRTEIVGTISATDMTLVTSGIYERKIEVDGKLYHHILSTETGYSVDSDMQAVTLTASKGHSVDCDALSTICLIKGSENAAELIESIDGIEAAFILNDGTIVQTSGMTLVEE